MIVELGASQTWSALVGGEGIEVRVAAGEAWLTRERDPEDHLLSAPEIFRSTWRGRLAVQALGPLRLEIRSLQPARKIVADPALPALTR
jgi:hypothetical protein